MGSLLCHYALKESRKTNIKKTTLSHGADPVREASGPPPPPAPFLGDPQPSKREKRNLGTNVARLNT